MKAISLHQPWASFVALGAKTVETRGWPTRHRGLLAIHAAKTPASTMNEYPNELLSEARKIDPRLQVTHADLPRNWPFGCIVAVAELADCLCVDRHVGSPRAHTKGLLAQGNGRYVEVPYADLVFGNLAPGRFAWILRNVRPLKTPIAVRGYQGFFTLDPKIERQIDAQTQNEPHLSRSPWGLR